MNIYVYGLFLAAIVVSMWLIYSPQLPPTPSQNIPLVPIIPGRKPTSNYQQFVTSGMWVGSNYECDGSVYNGACIFPADKAEEACNLDPLCVGYIFPGIAPNIWSKNAPQIYGKTGMEYAQLTRNLLVPNTGFPLPVAYMKP